MPCVAERRPRLLGRRPGDEGEDGEHGQAGEQRDAAEDAVAAAVPAARADGMAGRESAIDRDGSRCYGRWRTAGVALEGRPRRSSADPVRPDVSRGDLVELRDGLLLERRRQRAKSTSAASAWPSVSRKLIQPLSAVALACVGLLA